METQFSLLVSIILGVIAIILGFCWLLLPLLLLNKLNMLIKATEDSNLLLNVIANHTKPEAPIFPSDSA